MQGFEVKSIRAGSISLVDSFVSIVDGEAYIKNLYIKQYEKATNIVVNEKRPRKLLLHKREIVKLERLTKEKSYSGGIYAESSIIESVNNKQRQYTVPVSYYRDSTTIATSLHFEFMASKEGLINPNLIAGSQIKLISRNQVL